MEIFLSLVIIAIVVFFYIQQNAKFKKLHAHMDFLQKKFEEALKQKPTIVSDERIIVNETKIIAEGKKESPPVIIPEIKVEEKKEEVVLPPINEEIKKPEPVIAEVKTEEPVKPQAKVLEPQLSFWQKFKQRNPDLEKFIGENLLSKIAITILVLGIAFFVKYAIDKDWIHETARVGIGILIGSIIMIIAHKMHSKFKAFSSVLVAGAIAVFYFTIAIGFHEYHLFSQTVAFIIMLVVTGFSVFISIIYDRMELAALSITGGFSVPFILSTGEGNYKILFTYILILDIGMLVLAYVKKWNLINILAYAFTIVLFTAWLGTKVVGVENGPFAGAFLFCIIFYLVFVMMNVINNVKAKREFSYAELIILISNSFVFYISGMLILREWAWEYRGVFTVAMGVFNFALAFILNKYLKTDKKLTYLLIALTLSFATLAAPVQLKGSYITIFWAIEVAMLVWLAGKTKLSGFKLASLPVAFCMFISLLVDLINGYGGYRYDYNIPPVVLQPLLNKAFITGIFSAASLFLAAFFLSKQPVEENRKWHDLHPKIYANILKITFVFIAYLTGMIETTYQSNQYIYSGDSVSSISFFYHIAFTSILGMILLKRYNKANDILSFILLGLNLLFFTFVFTNLPYEEMKDRCEGIHGSFMSFVVHFGALAFLVMHLLFSIKVALRENNFIMKAKSVLLWTLGFFVIVLVSNEVILNLMVFKLKSFVNTDYYIVRTVYDSIHAQIIKTALPVTWGVIAFVFLSTGIKRQLTAWRIMALVLLAITLIKLFVYDIKDVSEAGKIIAFIILGIVLLVMSFMYQKIKAIIMDEEIATPKTENNNEEKTN